MDFIAHFIRQESKIFALAPIVYALALFLATFGFTTCLWSIVELLEWLPLAYNINITAGFALLITLISILVLRKHINDQQAAIIAEQ